MPSHFLPFKDYQAIKRGQISLSPLNPAALSVFFQGVFLVTTENAFVLVNRVYSVNTYSKISTVLRGSERSE